MDILGVTVGLILVLPVMSIVAILIRIENPRGPIMFTQERNSKYQKTFRMYKFCSIYVDAEESLQEFMHPNEQTGLDFKMKNDSANHKS